MWEEIGLLIGKYTRMTLAWGVYRKRRTVVDISNTFSSIYNTLAMFMFMILYGRIISFLRKS